MLIVTQHGADLINARDIVYITTRRLEILARLGSGQDVVLGKYDSNAEVAHVLQDLKLLDGSVGKFTFPPRGYYKKFYEE